MYRIMVQGTTSSAGKSLMCTGLCRIFREDGFKVYPFKSQNMSSKFYITEEGKKMSVAQALQARAAGLAPSHHMNPILLIPNSDTGSLVVINGEETENMSGKDYMRLRPTFKEMIKEKYKEIEAQSDVVVIEGAGSPAEINLKKDDFVNMGMAELADAPVLLVTDIDRGGSFAALYGTVMLLEPHERARIKGLIINKFRGDKTLLEPGIRMIEDLLNIPVVGVIPYMLLDLIDEDSLVDRNRESKKEEKNLEKEELELRKLSSLIRANMDMDYIYKIIGVNND
ncbi:MAG: cobyric acid synthase [Tissierellia bacterium]|jgi:adenosylcobyric acid synthase|nr:cobyric acid synthase [Tissierellia bacterium]